MLHFEHSVGLTILPDLIAELILSAAHLLCLLLLEYVFWWATKSCRGVGFLFLLLANICRQRSGFLYLHSRVL